MSTPSPSTTSRLRALSASLSPSDTNNTSTTAEIEQLRRDAQQHPTHRTSLHDPVALATAVAPPVSFKLDAEMSRAHLANQLCTGSGQLYVHSPAQVPSQYYICAKSLLQFDYSLSADNDVLLMPRLQQLRLRLVLFAEREHRYVYVLAEAYLPLRATHKGTFQFFVPPITNPRHFLGTVHAHLPDFKMQLFGSVDNWTGFLGDVWCGQLRSTRAVSSATEISNEAKLVGQKLRGRQPPPFLTANDDQYFQAAFQGTCHVKLAPDSILHHSIAIDAIERDLPPLADDQNDPPLANGDGRRKKLVGKSVKAPKAPKTPKTPKTPVEKPAKQAKSRARSSLSPSATEPQQRTVTFDPAVLASPPAPATRRKRVAPGADPSATADTANVTAPILPSGKRAAFTRAVANLNATTSLVPAVVHSPPLLSTILATTTAATTSSTNNNNDPSSDTENTTTSTNSNPFGSSPTKIVSVPSLNDLDALLMPPPTSFLGFSSPTAVDSRSRTSSFNSTSSSLPFGSPLGRTRQATRRFSLNNDDLTNDYSLTLAANANQWVPYSPNNAEFN